LDFLTFHAKKQLYNNATGRILVQHIPTPVQQQVGQQQVGQQQPIQQISPYRFFIKLYFFNKFILDYYLHLH
jgi:hypothetical protein